MKILLSSLLALLSFTASAQEVISTTGNTLQTEEVMLTWTIGEPVIATGASNAATLTQGFNQSEFVITALNKDLSTEPQVKIFPNPSPREVTITSTGQNTIESIVLTDILGNQLLSSLPETNTHTIDISSLGAETMILTIKTSDNRLSSFKVLKKK